jgi:lipid II:glycine glycyltransferase (peptidoglycan interpeptide bridge formation enzyme)
LPERVFHKRPDDELDYALWSNGFRFKGREISTAIPLDFTEADLWQQLEGGSSRSAARKAQRAGIRVGLSEDYDSFCPIAQKNLASRHKTKPVHSLDEMKKIRDLFPDRVFLFAAHKDDRMIAGVWALLVNSNGLHTFYVDQNYEFQRDRPLDLIFVELIRWALQRRYRFINLGISTNQGGSQLDEGLQRFKERHGGRGVMREIYFLKLTPNEKTAEPNPMA